MTLVMGEKYWVKSGNKEKYTATVIESSPDENDHYNIKWTMCQRMARVHKDKIGDRVVDSSRDENGRSKRKRSLVRLSSSSSSSSPSLRKRKPVMLDQGRTTRRSIISTKRRNSCCDGKNDISRNMKIVGVDVETKKKYSRSTKRGKPFSGGDNDAGFVCINLIKRKHSYDDGNTNNIERTSTGIVITKKNKMYRRTLNHIDSYKTKRKMKIEVSTLSLPKRECNTPGGMLAINFATSVNNHLRCDMIKQKVKIMDDKNEKEKEEISISSPKRESTTLGERSSMDVTRSNTKRVKSGDGTKVYDKTDEIVSNKLGIMENISLYSPTPNRRKCLGKYNTTRKINMDDDENKDDKKEGEDQKNQKIFMSASTKKNAEIKKHGDNYTNEESQRMKRAVRRANKEQNECTLKIDSFDYKRQKELSELCRQSEYIRNQLGWKGINVKP